jgi:hypothetical protein
VTVLMVAFVIAQSCDLLTWAGIITRNAALEANPTVASLTLTAALAAKILLIVFGTSVAAALVARNRYLPMARLMLVTGIMAGSAGAGANWVWL